MPRIRRALLSVSDKSGLIALARALVAQEIDLVASGGTAQALRDAGLSVCEVSDYTGSPEILGGRVKTLHPKVHGGILARRDVAADQQDLAAQDIEPIDLVVVNLYPFESTSAREDVTHAEVVEQIDIGGPTLLRAAAKNAPDVVTLCDPADYPPFLALLADGKGEIDAPFAEHCAAKVFARVAAYDAAISNYYAMQSAEGFPAVWTAQYHKIMDLRYGENPHQSAVWCQVADAAPWLGTSSQGKALSYNNLLDSEAGVCAVKDLVDYPYAAVVIKHGNPCGVGVSHESLSAAFARAKAGDPVSAFGGIVAVSRELDGASAKAIAETFFEVVLAPTFSPVACEILSAKKNLRLVPFDPDMDDPVVVRSLGGGWLVQSADAVRDDNATWQVVSSRAPTADEETSLRLAWRVAGHVRSNAIVFCNAEGTLGVGAGQMSRIDSTKLAAMKMDDLGWKGTTPCVAASDAFFPFRDGIDALAAAGVSAVIQPGGSKRDAEVIAAGDEHGLAMVLTGVRHFRH
jgi:phosphoribosylaminoimidazolecarboxamide formyltransferase / IMP cyclohydrolase